MFLFNPRKMSGSANPDFLRLSCSTLKKFRFGKSNFLAKYHQR